MRRTLRDALIALAVVFGVGSIAMLLAHVSPVVGFAALFDGALGNQSELAETLLQTTDRIAHGFDGFYPASPAPTTSANSFAVQAGGGLNLYLTRSLGIRLIEADYVRTALPNGAANTQNDMRLAFGVTYHIGKR